VCEKHEISCIPYFALAMGFLTGKYRSGGDAVDSPRAGQAAQDLDGRGIAVLEALEQIAAGHATTVAFVALAWVAAQPTVAAPIASARTPEQLAGLLPMAALALTGEEIDRLTTASA
jgi:aryl-alcohol dehydrogenase-like predicted oxidoreductase